MQSVKKASSKRFINTILQYTDSAEISVDVLIKFINKIIDEIDPINPILQFLAGTNKKIILQPPTKAHARPHAPAAASARSSLESPINLKSKNCVGFIFFILILLFIGLRPINFRFGDMVIYNIEFEQNTKCWWCKNTFTTPKVSLPEQYYNDTFYCIGNFCSYNCPKSYNLDLNDTLVWKRESLLNLLYYQTYSEFKNIIPAPHWITLKEYGGTLSIEEFRLNSVINTKEYLVLHPPLISRQMQIEESYKINKLKEVPLDKLNKLYSDIQPNETDCIIKRSKPVQSAQFNLEKTMGLIKKKKKN
jgi:hypothetical protein